MEGEADFSSLTTKSCVNHYSKNKLSSCEQTQYSKSLTHMDKFLSSSMLSPTSLFKKSLGSLIPPIPVFVSSVIFVVHSIGL